MARLRAIGGTRLYRKGSVVFEQDAPVKTVTVIADGTVRLYHLLPDGRRQVIGFLGPGDLLGGLKRASGAHCTAEAVVDVIACAFSRRGFLDLLTVYPQLTYGLLFTATDEIEAQQDHVVLLGRKHLEERLAAFLILFSRRWKFDDEPVDEVKLPMTRADIADYLGLTVESVSRAFTRFRKQGLIEMPDTHRVVLRNLPALLSMAGFDEVPSHGASLGL